MGGRSKHLPELPERAVRLARGSGRPISAVASDLGVHPKTLRAWVRQDEADDGKLEHSQIDFILVSRGLAERIAYVAIAHTTPAGQVSDHWPIVLDLSTPSEVASATP